MTQAQPPSPASVPADTGERMVPQFHKGELIYAEHITRYQSALPVVRGRTVLDIASGSGYGTRLLAEQAAQVIGVDIDADAVEYARANYGADNVEYRVGSGSEIPLEDAAVDVVVTFETIEHIADYRRFMSEVKRVLKPGGVALVSTPNELEFAEGNHFHLHEFEYDELVELVSGHFTHVESMYQATWKYVAVGHAGAFGTEGAFDAQTENLAPLKRDQSLYFYLACSDEPISVLPVPRAALGGHYSDRALIAHAAHVDGEIEHLRGLVVELRAEVGRVEVERARLQAQLGAVLNSRAIRYSEPLRRAYRRLRRTNR